ncbi:MAG: gamma carbonic anhydrase family protein [Elusimicrobiota bacterium]|jgi:carbonic anhydrase/acetyltransferase-like protein (isoleucine patch superfamily)
MIRALGSRSPKIHKTAFVHDSAEILGAVTLGPRSSVWPFCSLRGDIESLRVGEGSNVQDLCCLHTHHGHPVVIGKGVTIGHRAVLHGCKVGDGCLIGMGAVVLETSIGRGSLVGAGAMVPASLRVPPNSLVLGSPAKIIRKLKPEESRGLKQAAAIYVKLSKVHRKARILF